MRYFILFLTIIKSLSAMEDYGTFNITDQGQVRHPLMRDLAIVEEVFLQVNEENKKLKSLLKEEKEEVVIDIPISRVEKETQTEENLKEIQRLERSLCLWKGLTIGGTAFGFVLGIGIGFIIN